MAIGACFKRWNEFFGVLRSIVYAAWHLETQIL